MSPRAPWLRLHDILLAITEIRSFIAGLSWDVFEEQVQIQRAVGMNPVIIGEAITKMPHDWLAEHPDVPWSQIRGTRNIITHVYHGLDLHIIWSIATVHLDPLEVAIRELALKHVPKDSPS